MTVYEKKLVQEALQGYHIRGRKISFLRHNENITCRIVSGNDAWVLRIHSPMEGFSPGLYGTASAIDLMRGETELLLYLAERASFPVQIPVQNRSGEYVTVLSGGIPCELLQWIGGEPLEKDNANPYAGSLGAMAAEIHRAAGGFDGIRLSYSHDLVHRMEAELDLAYGRAHISREHRTTCQEVLDQADRIMAELDGIPGARSLIHADLGFGNVLRTPSVLCPIDFSLSGYGYRVQECGMLAANYIHEEQWECIREGYERAGGIAVDRHHMQIFRAFSFLLFIAAQHNRFWRERWFRDFMNRWTAGFFDIASPL